MNNQGAEEIFTDEDICVVEGVDIRDISDRESFEPP
jgi:hypothetical protein